MCVQDCIVTFSSGWNEISNPWALTSQWTPSGNTCHSELTKNYVLDNNAPFLHFVILVGVCNWMAGRWKFGRPREIWVFHGPCNTSTERESSVLPLERIISCFQRSHEAESTYVTQRELVWFECSGRFNSSHTSFRVDFYLEKPLWRRFCAVFWLSLHSEGKLWIGFELFLSRALQSLICCKGLLYYSFKLCSWLFCRKCAKQKMFLTADPKANPQLYCFWSSVYCKSYVNAHWQMLYRIAVLQSARWDLWSFPALMLRCGATLL